MKKKLLVIGLALAILLLVSMDQRLTVRHYTVEAETVTSPVRIVLVTDLHSCRYGKDMGELVDAIDAQQPDLVLLGGDIFDDELPDDNTAALLRCIGRRYPCYYVTGNHECWTDQAAFVQKMAIVDECGVTRLSGKAVQVTVNGQALTLCGVDDPYQYLQEPEFDFRGQLASLAQTIQPGTYSVLLSHRPELAETYQSLGFDLALCGHAHGGQVRLPGLLNGLYAPNQGWLPQWAGGLYRLDGMVEIVSRGLARESTRLPRIFNRPELVVIDLQ